MSNARGNNRARSCNVYEPQKLENIQRNKRKLPTLNIPAIVSSMAPQGQPKKTSKVRCKIVDEQFVMIVLSHMSFACRKIQKLQQVNGQTWDQDQKETILSLKMNRQMLIWSQLEIFLVTIKVKCMVFNLL
jgi:hypothetical protein